MSALQENDEGNQRQRPRTLPRLAHKKSRTGCLRCKARRIKCDENHPVCSACARHNVECNWPHALTRPGQNASPSTDSKSSEPSKPGPSSETELIVDELEPLESSSRRLLELRLLHQFSTFTCKTMPGCNIDFVSETWSKDVPPLALEPEHKNLLYGVFALAALHLDDAPESAPVYKSSFHQYFSLCLKFQNEAVANLSPKNADAVTLTCILISILTFRPRHEDTAVPSLTQRIVISNGAGRTFLKAWRWIVNDPKSKAGMITQVSPQYIEAMLGSISQDETDGRMIYPPESIVEPLQHLLNPALPDREVCKNEAWNEEIERTYSEALAYIGSIYNGIEAQESVWTVCRRFMGFTPMLSERFIQFVRDGEPRALVVLAHYYGLTKYVESVWWIKDTAYREVMEIWGKIPVRWRAMMDHPLDMVGVKRYSQI
ncbi:MAG: hypothetical protein M1820_008082 [Bogoriella megaspora]|nr:MAG: hypothetical protein M1820_008082 [Bogoriella megaspora]